MKKIILVANAARSMVKFRSNFIKKLLDFGFAVVVCVPYERDSFKFLEKLGVKMEVVKLKRSGMNPFQEISSLLQIRKILCQHKPYACMFYTIKPVIYGSLACRGLQINNIYSMIAGLGYVFVGSSFRKKVLRLFIKIFYAIALKKNRKVIFLNKDDANYFVKSKIVSGSQVCLVDGEGVNLEYYTYTSPPKNKILFIFGGRLLKDKGLIEYVNAARVLKHKYDVVFKIAGRFDDNPSCIGQKEMQLWVDEGVVEYLGFLKDVREALRQASVFVLPTFYREGMPVSILEAMATGRAVITTDIPGCREIVEDGVNGFLIPAKDTDALVKAMEKFILDPKLSLDMGLAGRKMVEDKFEVNKISLDIINGMGLL